MKFTKSRVFGAIVLILAALLLCRRRLERGGDGA